MIASYINRPTPGQAVVVSVNTAPAINVPACSPRFVTTGRRALRKAWEMMIVRSRSPLARAVTM